LLRGLGTLATLGLLVYLLYQQGWNEILAAIRQIPPLYFILAFILILISRFAVVARWHVLLHSAGIGIRFSNTTRITFAGLFASNFLPTTIGGDVVRLIGAVQLGYDSAICTASLVVDRLVGMAGMLITTPLCLPGLPSAKPGAAILTTPALVLSLALPPRLHRLWEKGRQLLKRFLQALVIWTRRPVSLAQSLAWTGIHMLCVFAILHLCLSGMGESISFWLVAGLYSLVYLVTLIPISINGYGLQEISMTFVFAQMGKVSMSSALTTALLFRTIVMLASLPGALFVPGMLKFPTQNAGQEHLAGKEHLEDKEHLEEKTTPETHAQP
jgi:hypothetical protein